MGNKQKLFENIGSLGILLVLGALIAAAILPWWVDSSSCAQAWFQQNCNNAGNQPLPQPRGTMTGQIYNAAYGLTVSAGAILVVLIIIFLVYVFGSRNTRCVPGHAVVSLVICAAVLTFALGLPAAYKNDLNQQSVQPFFGNSNGSPGIGWYIALAACVVQAIVFVLLFCAFR